MKTPKHLPKLNTQTTTKPDPAKPLTPERAKEIIDEVWSKKRFVQDQPLLIIQKNNLL